jgi:hypothetical protein
MLTRNFLIAALAAAGCAIPARASITTFSTPSSFSAATIDYTFSDISFTQEGIYSPSTSDLGVVFSTSSTLLPYLDGTTGGALGGSWPAGSALYSMNSSGGNTLTITLPSAVNAISLYAGLDSTSDSIQISLTDAGGGTPDTFNVSPSVNLGTPYFIGVTTNTSFSTFTITSSNSADKITIDDMQIGQGQAQATPEVATFLLVGTGLLAMGYIKRRTIRRQPLRTAIA